MTSRTRDGRDDAPAQAFFSLAPWWLPLIFAGVVLGISFGFFPSLGNSSAAAAAFVKAFTPIIHFASVVGAAILAAVAIIQFFAQRKSAQRLVAPEAGDPEFMVSTGTRLSAYARPTAWSLDLLRELEWKRFEELAAAFYREAGLRSETIRCGADGGIDATLYEEGKADPVAIVQCKAWNSRMVGVAPVRELLGVMTHNKVGRGVFLTTGTFTAEAVAFAKSNPIDLVGGADFLALILKLDHGAQRRLLAFATEGDYRTPSCPSCGIKTVWRESGRGNFWGCPKFPRCRTRFHMGNLVAAD